VLADCGGAAGRLAPVVVDEVRGDAEQVVAPVLVVLERGAGAEEAIVGFLQQIVRQPAVAGHAREVEPDLPRRLVVEGAERLLVHQERALRLVEGAKAFQLGQRDVTHGCSRGFRTGPGPGGTGTGRDDRIGAITRRGR
jgi:hypothetical protein